MIVQNLIYNKLGNSFSLMIQVQENIIQLHDQVHFSLKSVPVSVEGISTLEKDIFLISIKAGEKIFIIKLLEKDGLWLVYEDINIKYVSDSFEYFISNDSFEEIIKLVNEKYDFIDILKKKDGYKIKLKDQFLKGLLEILHIKGVI